MKTRIAPPVLALALAAALPSFAAAASNAEVFRKLSTFIEREMSDKKIPALSIVIVDGGKTVWAKGFGYADPGRKIRASKDTVYRVGSVSKLFADIAVMQSAERGEIDIDAPVARYLPEFQPQNPFSEPITLRRLMCHRSGLVGEPPVGHYFDASNPSVQATVASLSSTKLVYAPGSRTKYSNAAVTVPGYALERLSGKPFAALAGEKLLAPLGMRSSGFLLTPALRSKLAKSYMWTYDGRTFEAPVFELGILPAGNLYSTVDDLGRFIAAMLDGGRPLLRKETLDDMWRPQEGGSGFGIGFALGQLDGHRMVGHGGAVYGFATDVSILPDAELGVAAAATMDSSNAVVSRIARQALRWMLEARSGKPLSEVEKYQSIPESRQAEWAGRYGEGVNGVELLRSGQELYLLPLRGGQRVRLRQSGESLVADDLLAHGTRLVPSTGGIRRNGQLLKKAPDVEPPPAREEWRELIGEYGWDFNVLYVLEREGRLTTLIEWYDYYPLEQVDGSTFRFPDWGLYDGESLTFQKNSEGKVVSASVGGVVFPRRSVGPASGQVFRIEPVRPVEELRRQALAAKPPREKGPFLASDLVDLAILDPGIKLDIRYAGTDNFLGTPVYSQARAFLQRPAAEALARAHRKLKEQGYGLLIHDAYRPWYVTKIFWDATPPDKRIFVADPAKGSRHNRGCAVDLTLYELATGKTVEMVGGYDEMSPRSYPDYPGGTSLQRRRRAILREAMESENFTVYEVEWWHFDYNGWRRYGIQNQPFQ